MTNRFCPSEIILSEYLNGCLPEEYVPGVEKHLSECSNCRELLIDSFRVSETCRKKSPAAMTWLRKNHLFAAALASLALSFFINRYFLQFLLLSFLLGMKWIIDSRQSKTLITINKQHAPDREEKNAGIKNGRSKLSSLL